MSTRSCERQGAGSRAGGCACQRLGVSQRPCDLPSEQTNRPCCRPHACTHQACRLLARPPAWRSAARQAALNSSNSGRRGGVRPGHRRKEPKNKFRASAFRRCGGGQTCRAEVLGGADWGGHPAGVPLGSGPPHSNPPFPALPPPPPRFLIDTFGREALQQGTGVLGEHPCTALLARPTCSARLPCWPWSAAATSAAAAAPSTHGSARGWLSSAHAPPACRR